MAGGGAVLVRGFDGIGAAELVEREPPQPGEGEVAVRMEAMAIHPLDALIAAGGIPFAAEPPLVLGAVGAGEVVSDGASFAAGDRVAVVGREMGMVMDGVWAERAVVPERLLLALPDAVSYQQGAALGIASPTADLALGLLDLEPGSSLLVLGGTGAVGSAAIQLARAAGLEPVGASRSAAGAEFVAGLGASEAIDLSREDLAAAVARRGSRFDAIVDPVGGELTAAALKTLRPGGTQVVLGYSAGFETTVSLPDLVTTGSQLRGGSMDVAGPEGLREAEERCLAAVAAGTLELPLAASFGLGEVGAAYAAAADPARFGRVLLEP